MALMLRAIALAILVVAVFGSPESASKVQSRVSEMRTS